MTAYDFDGDAYLKASGHQKEWGRKLISELPVRHDSRILDLGCGDGTLTRMISEKVPAGIVVGIDASEGMIRKAREYETDNCRFFVKDINALDYTDEFDMIISNATLHWIKDHRALLANCRKGLHKGGIIRFNFAGEGNCLNFNTVVRGLMSDIRYRRYFEEFEWPWYMPATPEYLALFESNAFTNVKVWSESADRYFRDEDEMNQWIRMPSLVPFLRVINNDSDKENFALDTMRLMADKTRQEDSRCFEYFRRLNVYAEKPA
jgi:trans-aconitate 2-methyltransferase